MACRGWCCNGASQVAKTKGLLLMRILVAGLLLSLALYGAVLTLLWAKQESLLFQPSPWPADRALPVQANVFETHVDVPGARLSVLHMRLPAPKGVVFFLHGNGGNLASWFVNVDFYRVANLDLVMVDYRGYGKSTGRIASEQQLRADVRAVWAHFAPQYAGKKLVVLGRSLGTGLAAGLARELAQAGRPVALTVLVSPYSSMQALVKQIYPWVPSSLLRYPLRTDEDLPQVQAPVLLIHGAKDALIDPSHSATLQMLVPQAQRVLIDGAGHNDLQEFPAYLHAVMQALRNLNL